MKPKSQTEPTSATAGGGIAAAAASTQAVAFGIPDEPPQGAVYTSANPASATDSGPQNPVLTGQFKRAFSPLATNVGDMPLFGASFNNAPRRIQNGSLARQVTQADFAIAETISGVNMRLTGIADDGFGDQTFDGVVISRKNCLIYKYWN